MSQDIVHRPAATERLVAAVGVDGELAEQGAVGGDDAHVGAGDKEEDLAVAAGGADWDVAQLAEVAQGDFALGVDAVATRPVVGGCFGLWGPGLDARVEDDQRGLPAQGSVRSLLVVLLAEAVKLHLQVGQRLGRGCWRR